MCHKIRGSLQLLITAELPTGSTARPLGGVPSTGRSLARCRIQSRFCAEITRKARNPVRTLRVPKQKFTLPNERFRRSVTVCARCKWTNATMCHRYLATIAWMAVALCVSVSCRAGDARASFGISITILSACVTDFDEMTGNVSERCSSPRPYRIETARFQPRRVTEQVERNCDNDAQQSTPVTQAEPCHAQPVNVVTIIY